MAGEKEKIINTRIYLKAGDTFITCPNTYSIDGLWLADNTKYYIVSLNPSEGQPDNGIQVNYTNLDSGWKGSLNSEIGNITLDELEDQVNIPGAIVSLNDEPVKVVPDADAIVESYKLDNVKTILIPTGLYGKDNLAIFDSLAGQLSDGMWENSPRMTKYWEYMDYKLGEDNQVMIRVPEDYRWWLGFESTSAVKKWIADHLKALVKEYIKYNEGEWSRDCDIRFDGWFHRPEPEIREVYRVYDKLLGRKDRVGSTVAYVEDYKSDNKSLEESTFFDYSINFRDAYFYYLNKAGENGWVIYTVSTEDYPNLDAENMIYEEFDTWEDAKKFAQEHNIDRIIVNSFGWEGPSGYDNGDYVEFDEQWLDLNHELLDKEIYLDNLDMVYVENLSENWRPNNLTTVYSIEHLPLERDDTYYKVRTLYDRTNLITYITKKGFRVDITPAVGKGGEAGCASLMFKSISEAQEFLRKADIPESNVEIYLARFSPFDYKSGLWKLNTELGETYIAGYRLGDNELFRNISDPDAILENLVKDTTIAGYDEDINKSLDYKEKFKKRTKEHIDRVNKYAQKIGKSYPEHDSDKFAELYDGYSLMSKDNITKEEQALIDEATFKHVRDNEHHCEHWVDPKSIEGFSRNNPTPHGCLDCSKMPENALEEMCCDWCAMSEEFNNTPFEWYLKNKDTRWHFNEEQDKFILDTLHKLWDKNLEENTDNNYYLCAIYGGYNCQELLADNIEVDAKNEEQAKKVAIKIYKQEYNYSKEDNPFGLKAEIVSSDKDDDLEEDIEKHEELNPKLFDGEELKPEVKETVEKIAKEFLDELANDGIKFDLKDIVLIGSNVSYNYSKDSDLDIHLIADSTNLTCPDNLYPLLYSAYRSMFNGSYDITINGIPAEIYVEMDEPQARSNGIYSLNSGWIKKPVQQNIPDLDKEAFDKLFNEWEDKYFDLIKKGE